MTSHRNIYLVGPMGAGKSTIGKRLARKLNKDFFDSDKVIEETTGANIPLIFDLEGEEGFRKRERAAIVELTMRDNIVLATGGGVILDPENRASLQDNGLVIYLHTSVDQQLARTSRDTNRPLLQTDDPHQKLQDLFDIRDPLYRETAHMVISTDGRSVPQVVRKISDMLKS